MAHGTPKNDPLPDWYLREIGRVAVEWSKVEAALETIIWAFLFIDFEQTSAWHREPEGRAVTTHINLLLRVDMMLSLKSAAAAATLFNTIPVFDELDGIAKEVRALYPRRNKVVHSIWSPVGTMVLRQSYRARGDVSPLYDVMTLEDVKTVADEAEALYLKLDEFIPRLSLELRELRTQWYKREKK